MHSPILGLAVLLSGAWAGESGAVVLEGEVAPGGAALDRIVTGDGADLSLFYGSEERGVVGTCGCDTFPKGGLGRVRTVLEAAENHDPNTPHLLLNAGGWLSNGHSFDNLSDRALALNASFVRTLRHGRWNVLNASYRDLPGLEQGGLRPGLVSANLRPQGLPVVRYSVLSAGEWTVAVTGVTRDGGTFLWPEGTAWVDPVVALNELVPQMQADADLVVVLVHDLPTDVPRIAAVKGIDLIIEAGDYRERYDPLLVDGTVWVRSWAETTRLSEVRLWVEAGEIVRVVDRKIDLDPMLAVDAVHTREQRRAERALEGTIGR